MVATTVLIAVLRAGICVCDFSSFLLFQNIYETWNLPQSLLSLYHIRKSIIQFNDGPAGGEEDHSA